MTHFECTSSTRRVLGAHVQSASARETAWKMMLDPASLGAICITPEESARNAPLACRLRAAILQRTYRNDYHTDTSDVPRLSQAVREGRERILFWGHPTTISNAREWFATGASPEEAELQVLDFGTASTLDLAGVYGSGYAELSRTGSMCMSITADRPIVADLFRLLRGGAEQFRSQHSFVALPRNRRTTREVRGGAAVHRMHVRTIGSAFWGIAPWYLMQGGVIEALDYREVYRCPELILDLYSEVRELWFESQEGQAYVGNLVALNFGEEVRAVAAPRLADKRRKLVSGWKVYYTGPENLRAFCPAIIRPSNKEGDDLDAIVDQASEAAATAVFVPLEQPERASVQYWLARAGFRLTGVVPSKPTERGRTPVTGVWSRSRPEVPWAEPQYLDWQVDGIENEIINYLRLLCREHASV
jgi:hypothetical protein